MKSLKFILKLVLFVPLGFIVLGAILLTLAGVLMAIPAPQTDVTNRKPFIDFIGREYRVVGGVNALAWNAFPDKNKILSISLMTPPLVRNRYVSYSKALNAGQTVRIVSARREITVSGFIYKYVVSLPGSGLPEGVPITTNVNSDGILDSRVFELRQR